MIPLVLLLLRTNAQDPPKSLYQSIIQTRNVNNGYEEYLRAADLGRVPDVKAAYESVTAAKPGSPDWLTTRKKLSEKCVAMSSLISEGNKKNVTDPRTTLDLETLFPEYAAFKSVSKYLVEVVTVQMSSGQSVRATDTAISNLIFGEKVLGTGVLITYLVGTAMQSISMKSINDNMDRIPEPSWRQIIKFCDQSLASSSFINTLSAELQASANNMDSFLNDPNMLGIFSDDLEMSAFVQEVKALSPTRRAEIKQTVLEATKTYLGKVKAGLVTPEKYWDQESARADRVWDSVTDHVAHQILSSWLPVFSQSHTTELKRRTQIRLLKLHGNIQLFRWDTGRLPKSLAELDDSKSTVDPLSEAPFHYERYADGYALYSDGVRGLGRIDLVYKRSTIAEGPDSGGP